MRPSLNARALRHAIDGALVAAAAWSSGCCGRPYGPAHDRYVEILREPLAVEVDDSGGYPLATCNAICPRDIPMMGDETNVAACYPASFRMQHTTTRTVLCKAYGPEFFRKVPAEQVAGRGDGRILTAAGRRLSPKEEPCYSACGGEGSDVYACDLAPAPAPPPPNERYVVCDYVTPGGCSTVVPSGRRPAGYSPARASRGSRAPRGDETGKHFARIAELEGASVVAFRILAAELRAHGAPSRLVRRAHRAARDEIRHAHATSALARRFGVSSTLPHVRRMPPRSMLEMALENAVEGCVGETFGAAIALRQSQQALDLAVRRLYTRIACDEVRHAALAWAVHSWCEARLDANDRRELRAALRQAAHRLVSTPPAASGLVAARTGIPALGESRAIAKDLAWRLWGVARPSLAARATDG